MDLFDNIPLVEQPISLKKKLFRHQLASIHTMEKLEKEKKIIFQNLSDVSIDTKIGIYSDIQGYGKTLSMIGLIVRDKMEWSLNSLYDEKILYNTYGSGLVQVYNNNNLNKINCTIIVANQSLISQWKEELGHTTLKVETILTKKKSITIDPKLWDVVICSPTMYNFFAIRFKNFAFKRFIYDEPTHSKIPSMKKIASEFYWLITATPNLLLYANSNRRKNHFLNSIFSYNMNIGIFNSLVIKNDDNFVKMSYKMPEIEHIYHECYEPIYNMVKGLISPPILEMISAGNIEGAINILGGNKTSNILDLVKKRKQEELDEAESKIRINNSRENFLAAERWGERKKMLESQIEELENRFSSILEENCSICLNKFKKPILAPCCQNIFCGGCLLQWIQASSSKGCPLCRRNIDIKDLVYIETSNKSSPPQKISKKLNKNEKIIDIISEKDGKFIIFSSHDETFYTIRSILNEKNIKFVEISGRKETRDRRIQDFRNGDTNVMFLNTKNNGAGINLPESSDIILYHNTCEDFQKQVFGRALRIGRKNNLFVHHLIHSGNEI